MKKLALTVTVVLLALPAMAQEPDEAWGPDNKRPVRMPTVEEIQREIDRAANQPPIVTIDPYDARRALQEMIDSADDDEAVFFYYKLYDAKMEHQDQQREIEELQRRVDEQRERRRGAGYRAPRNEP